MEKLGLNLGTLLVQIFHFAILFVVLRAWVYKPILGMLDKRRKLIAQGIEDARIAAEARANAELEATRITNEAQAKAAQLIREANERADAVAQEIRAAADAEVVKAREAALADVEKERDLVLAELRGQVAALAIAAAQKLIGESLDEKRQHALLDEFFSGVKSGRLVMLDNVDVTGGAAEITSALPLTAEEQNIVRKDLLPKLGGSAAITFRVDPKILGGLVIKVGDRLVDGSVAGQLQALRQNLQ